MTTQKDGQQHSPQPQLSAEQLRANRRTMYIIFGLILAVIASSTLLFRLASSGVIDLPTILGTRNHGTLISPPLPIADLGLGSVDGVAFDYFEGPARWTALLPFTLPCDERCEHHLYISRQVRTALGRDMNQMRRLLVLPDGVYPAPDELAWLASEHPGLQVLYAAPEAVQALAGVAPPVGEGDAWLLVDPNGWVMMHYDSSQSGNEILSDLKFLIKQAHGQ